jgi:hypothetical protein
MMEWLSMVISFAFLGMMALSVSHPRDMVAPFPEMRG